MSAQECGLARYEMARCGLIAPQGIQEASLGKFWLGMDLGLEGGRPNAAGFCEAGEFGPQVPTQGTMVADGCRNAMPEDVRVEILSENSPEDATRVENHGNLPVRRPNMLSPVSCPERPRLWA